MPGQRKSVPFVIIPYSPLKSWTDTRSVASALATALFGSIVSPTRPRTISTSKTINRANHQIPGGSTAKTEFGSFSEERVSFSVRFVEKNDTFGVSTKIKALDLMRHPNPLGSFSPVSKTNFIETDPFTPPPKVLFWYGTGLLFFMPYYINSISYDTSLMNRFGFPQVVDVSFDLTLDEESLLYKGEQFFRYANLLFNATRNLTVMKKGFGKKNPYITSGISNNKKFDRFLKKISRTGG